MPPRIRKFQSKRPIESYDHRDKERLNNPPVGLVTPETDRDVGHRTYVYDPHLDPELQWAGKAEYTSFDVPSVSLHVHERIDPRSIIEVARESNGDGDSIQGSLFELPEENPPVRSAIEFYRHRHNWSNRLVAGDSLLVMNSLLEKEGMAGKFQMIYIDPPYGIRYGSNFQPFVDRRVVRDGRDEDLTQEPETIKAFRDTWELGIHSYLSYLRDRLLLARDLLSESGSVFVQIGDENIHFVRVLLDEVFGNSNFHSQITFKKTLPLGSSGLAGISDYLLWYAKDKKNVKYRQLFEDKAIGENTGYRWVQFSDGTRRRMKADERKNPSILRSGVRPFFTSALASSGYTPSCMYDFEFEGKLFKCGNKSWRTHADGMKQLIVAGRIMAPGALPTFVQFHDDFPVQPLHNLWNDTHGATNMTYAVQTSVKVIQRCVLMTTDPGDLVFDPTCGSGTTAYVAEQWGRRWITCDTSRVAIALAKQRLMTALYDFYELAHPEEGVGSGFKYKNVPHVTLGSIANNPDITENMSQEEIDAAIARFAPQEALYDKPLVDVGKRRVTGPFSVEAVPAPAVKTLDDVELTHAIPADNSVSRSGETLRQSEWREEMLKTGIRGKSGQFIRFARLEPLPVCSYLHADGEILPSEDGVSTIRDPGPSNTSRPGPSNTSRRVLVSFGPEHAPLEQRQVNQALQEAQTLVPTPRLIIFAAFQFDPEASKDIDETYWPGIALLKTQMNADLLTGDLKRKRASNESYWLIGQPDVQIQTELEGKDAGKLRVSVLGFDYYNTVTGDVESGGKDNIAMWMLDPSYDGRSLYPRQVFFPMAGSNGGWAPLSRDLKAELDVNLMEAFRGTVSLPFEPGGNRRIAVKIIDDRGIESLKVIGLESPQFDSLFFPSLVKSLEEVKEKDFREGTQEEGEELASDQT